MITDDDVQKQWQKLHRLSLAQLKDGRYMFAIMSESNAGPPNIDRFLSRKMTKEAYDHPTNIYRQASSCPTSGNRIVLAPSLDKLVDIKKLV
jgi:hypothetical protein